MKTSFRRCWCGSVLNDCGFLEWFPFIFNSSRCLIFECVREKFWLSILWLNFSILSYGFSHVQEKFERLKWETKKISKGNIFILKSNLDSEKDQVVPKKVKFDMDFLGCVECSTNGNLLGKSRIFVPPSCLADTKGGGELTGFKLEILFPLHLKFYGWWF